MKRTVTLAAGLIAAVIAFASSPAMAQSKLVLKASDVHPTGYPTVTAVEDMGKKLSAATNGRLSVAMYPSMQLGGEKEAIEQAQVGAIAFARVSVGALGPVVDDLNVFNLPYVFRNTEHMRKVIDGQIGQDLLDQVTDSGKGLVGLCWMDAGARSFYDTKKPIKTLADLKGLKFRVMGNPMFVAMANSMGANGVPMGYDQVFSALQTGVVDGAENNPPSFVFDNHYQVAKFYTIDEHLIVPEMLVMSKKIFDSLSKDDQAHVKKFAREAQMEERKLWDVYQQKAMDKAKAAGIQIIQVSDAEKKKFQEAVKPVWDKYGPKYADMIKRIQDVEVTRNGTCAGLAPALLGFDPKSVARHAQRVQASGMTRSEPEESWRLLPQAMDCAYLVCVWLAGVALVLISAVIPWAVYTRYVLNSAASWPEPTAVLLTIVLTFFGAAACYRLGTHMNVTIAIDALAAARAPRRGFGRRNRRC